LTVPWAENRMNENQRSNTLRRNLFFLVLFISIPLVLVFCLCYGETSIQPGTIWKIMVGRHVDPQTFTIFTQIRLPRVLLAFAIGAGLSMSGTVFQGVLQNPLAEPYTLGVSGGAALGVAVGMLFFHSTTSLYVFALIGSLLAISFVYLIAARGLFSISTLVLGGIVLSYIFSSLILMLFSLVSPSKFQIILMWLMGDLSSAQPSQTVWTSIIVVMGGILLFSLHRELDVLVLGQERSGQLGLDPIRTIRRLFIIASLLTAACVASSGLIGFVGLIVPHFVRRFTGVSHALVLPGAFLSGAIFLLIADTAARTIIYPLELPVGVITGILGGFVFLAFLLKARRWSFFQ
jgi:iron complex transport system permease protein